MFRILIKKGITHFHSLSFMDLIFARLFSEYIYIVSVIHVRGIPVVISEISLRISRRESSRY